MESNGKFSYTYSAQQHDEVKRIRERYAPQEEDKLAQLRRLDQSTKKTGRVASLVVGIIGSLLLGTGMACIMEWPEDFFMVGVAVGVVGVIGMVLAYPIYSAVTKKRRAKIAPEIIRLSDEIMQ